MNFFISVAASSALEKDIRKIEKAILEKKYA